MSIRTMEGNIDAEKLILEIQIRPALWDMTKGDYSDRMKKKQCWEEVTDCFADKDLAIEDKKKLGELLHKKWKNIRDRFAREIQSRKGKSGMGARKKIPYMYAQQLQFLKDTLLPKKTSSSLKNTSNELFSDEELQQPGPSTSTTQNVERPQVGKKRLNPFEQKLLSSLERHEKKANMEKKPDDDNRYFLLSLLPTLASLPRRLNTNCRIELMQCIAKYEGYALQQCPQQSTFSVGVQQHNHSQQMVGAPPQQSQLHPLSNQLYERAWQGHPEYQSETLMHTPSPAESVRSLVSNFASQEDSEVTGEDSQFSIF